jgi:hypothetical protein
MKYRTSPEELEIMHTRLIRILNEIKTREVAIQDYLDTFLELGFSRSDAVELCLHFLNAFLGNIDECQTLQAREAYLRAILADSLVFWNDRLIEFQFVLDNQDRTRTTNIVSQVSPYLQNITGKVIDFGAGSGVITQRLHNDLNLDIVGADVRCYPASNVKIPMRLLDGYHHQAPDGTYEAGLVIYTLHHDRENENILEELNRIVRRRLIILETVPMKVDDADMQLELDRIFMNDYLYNRIFHDADIPVPGTYETPGRWVSRFAKHGWKCTHTEDLGNDQPTINAKHYLLVFERNN